VADPDRHRLPHLEVRAEEVSAVGVLLIGFGALAIWAGFARVSPLDVIRAVLGASVPARTDKGYVASPPTVSGANQPSPGVGA
jgi:hypothetical protein